MFKKNDVKHALDKMFAQRSYRTVTAGEVAKEANVSKNTAKKYLKEIENEDNRLYSFLVELRNGLIMTCWAYTERIKD